MSPSLWYCHLAFPWFRIPSGSYPWYCFHPIFRCLDLVAVRLAHWIPFFYSRLILPLASCFHQVARVDLLSSQVAELTEAVARLSARLEPASTAPSSYEVVSSVAAPRAPSAASLGGASSSVASSSAIYNELANEIPPVPEALVRDCSVLTGAGLSPYHRAERAWKIGYWARFCLEGRLHRPRPSPGIDLANQCYVVLRAPGFEVPLLALRAADYRHIVGDFKNNTISHGFPSQKEARIYCEAAGVRFPERPWQFQPTRR